jgi:hypothetical protein
MIRRIDLRRNIDSVFDHFSMYHTKILLEYFNAKVGKNDILK